VGRNLSGCRAQRTFFCFTICENIDKKEGSAAEKIAERLVDKKMNQLLPVLKAVVLGWKGPLQEGEVERAKEYGRRLATELKK
jgi:hypothetical protein